MNAASYMLLWLAAGILSGLIGIGGALLLISLKMIFAK
jgi:uncharacterized membrane protein YfcA